MCNGRHRLVYHPASVRDIERAKDRARRERTLARLKQYTKLREGAQPPARKIRGVHKIEPRLKGIPFKDGTPVIEGAPAPQALAA